MSDAKGADLGKAGKDDNEWADALDEWEQKAFSSTSPPPPMTPAAEPRVPTPSRSPVVEEPAAARPEAGRGTLPSLEVDIAELSVVEEDGPALEDEAEAYASEGARLPRPVGHDAVGDSARRSGARAPAVARPNVVGGALQALADLEAEAARSRAPMPARQVDAAMTELLEEQATWLEAEAEAAEGEVRARAYLALSEIRAILGDRERAHNFAVQARDLAPQLVLAHMQARTLADAPSPSAEAEALIAEESSTVSEAGKAHAAFLAATALQRAGDTEGALLKLGRVADAGDIRGIVGRAAFGLAAGEDEALSTFASHKKARPIAAGLWVALRLRGALPTDAAAGAGGSAEAIAITMRGARRALAAGDTLTASRKLGELRDVPELANGAAWLGAALATTKEDGRADAVAWLGELAKAGERRASRVLAARAVEADDGQATAAALSFGGFSTADEMALSALLEIDLEVRDSTLASTPEMRPLAAAIAAMEPPPPDGTDPALAAAKIAARARRVVGPDGARAAAQLGRLLAANAPISQLDDGIHALRSVLPVDAAALEIELALRQEAFDRVSDLVRAWGSHDAPTARPADAALAGGLVAERAGDTARAIIAYREARSVDPSSEVALRAMAAVHDATDLPGELNHLAGELGSTVQGALIRLEAVIREDSVADVTRADLLERAHQAAPSMPFASFLMERIALRSESPDDDLRWIEERRTGGADPTQLIVDLVREARLIVKRDPEASAAKLAEAHRLRPADLALREIYERALREPPADRTTFWEGVAANTTGDARTLFYLRAAHDYERVGDPAGALRSAQAAAADDTALGKLARDRAELEGGEAARLVDEILTEAKATDSTVRRREAYERLADIDGAGRGDPASALLWHQSILEETPAFLPSLRYVEHALITEGRDDELEPLMTALAHALHGSVGGEAVAHADFAARLRARGAEGNWDSTLDLADLAASDSQPSLTSLRLLQAHARVRQDDEVLISTTEQLLARATRPVEMAALRLRVAEAAFRQSDLASALANLERGAAEDPGDLVAFRLLAEVRHASGDAVGAAEAHESIARLSLVPSHQLEAWYDAARLWLDDAHDAEHGVQALEQAAVINLRYEDVFPRLAALYSATGAHLDLAALLERRIAMAADADERVSLEVERGRALLASGDRHAARTAVSAALAERPDHTTALATFAELSAVEEDWEAAEGAWIRLARLLPSPDEQREVYGRLGDLYSTKAVHLERAELAFKEVLKRAPDDTATRVRLVDVHRRQRDVSRAVEVQQQLVSLAKSPAEKRDHTVTLALLYEDPGHDDRKAEQVLDAARREFVSDVVVLRALAEFYVRHNQTPALNILLDRAVGDARRAFAAGRFSPALFETMQGVFELRGRLDAARVVGAGLSAMQAKPADVRGAFVAALDPRLDDLLAPDVLSAAMRSLLTGAGAALDAAAPLDLRAMAAMPAGPEARMITELATSFARGLGLSAPQVYVSKTVGRTCLPATSSPPALVVGEALLSSTDERAIAFIVMRAVKLIAAHASALVRTPSTELAVLVPAWLQTILPTWTPQGVNPTALAAATRKLLPGLPAHAKQQLGSLAAEVASQLGTRGSTLGALALAWANRAALLGVGDPNAALEALAWSLGSKDGAPLDPQARVAWIGRTHEAKDLLIFSIGDAYAEARTRLGLDR